MFTRRLSGPPAVFFCAAFTSYYEEIDWDHTITAKKNPTKLMNSHPKTQEHIEGNFFLNFIENKNVLTAASVSLAWILDRENSTRNRIYSLKVFYFSALVSDDRKYVCGSRLYACIKKIFAQLKN